MGQHPIFPLRNPKGFHDFRKSINQARKEFVQHCLFPGCENPKLVNSHTISMSILRKIRDKNGKVIEAVVDEMSIYKKQASLKVFSLKAARRCFTFKMLCLDHDQVFLPADEIDLTQIFSKLSRDQPLTPGERQAIFLWNYRAVFKGLSMSIMRFHSSQSILHNFSVNEIIPKLNGTEEEVALGSLAASMYMEEVAALRAMFYVRSWHNIYSSKKWDVVYYRDLPQFKGGISVAVSSIFSLDDLNIYTPARSIVTVLPSNEESTAVMYCSLPDHSSHLDDYLGRIVVPEKREGLRNRVSLQVLRDVPGIALSPAFWYGLPTEKRKDIETLFVETFLDDTHGALVGAYANKDVSLFREEK